MNIKFLFISLVLLYALFTWLLNDLIITDDIYWTYLQNQLSNKRIEFFLNTKKQWQWLAYTIIPIITFLKIALVSTGLLLGSYLVNIKYSFRQLFSVVTTAEFTYLLPPLIFLVWFSFVKTNYSLEDTQDFSPLSLLNLFSSNTLQPWEKYPLSMINIFQIIYIMLLSHGLSEESQIEFGESLKIVLCTYVPGLLLWIALMTFLIVSFS
jgi:hypothetical protein